MCLVQLVIVIVILSLLCCSTFYRAIIFSLYVFPLLCSLLPYYYYCVTAYQWNLYLDRCSFITGYSPFLLIFFLFWKGLPLTIHGKVTPLHGNIIMINCSDWEKHDNEFHQWWHKTLVTRFCGWAYLEGALLWKF